MEAFRDRGGQIFADALVNGTSDDARASRVQERQAKSGVATADDLRLIVDDLAKTRLARLQRGLDLLAGRVDIEAADLRDLSGGVAYRDRIARFARRCRAE